jgi:hypothetical protein
MDLSPTLKNLSTTGHCSFNIFATTLHTWGKENHFKFQHSSWKSMQIMAQEKNIYDLFRGTQ